MDSADTPPSDAERLFWLAKIKIIKLSMSGTDAQELNLPEGRGDRQISILTSKIRNWMDENVGKGLCLGRFEENILIDGIEKLTPNQRLKSGDIILRISQIPKSCHEQCNLFEKELYCPLAYAYVFASVERGGTIRVGEVMTLS